MSTSYNCNVQGFVRQGAPIASLLEENFEACKAKCDQDPKCTQFYTTFDTPDADSTRCVLLDGNNVSGKVLDMSYLPDGDTFCLKNSQNGPDPLVPSITPPTETKKRISNKTLFFILIGVFGGTAFLALIGIALYTWMQRRKVSYMP